jgi:hypothetical protein
MAALTGLAVGAVHGVRSATSLTTPRAVAQAARDDRYYQCLSAQARTLVRPGQTIEVSSANLGNWATLAKAVASWTVLTDDRRQAVAILSLEPRRGSGACLGSVVVAHYRDGSVRWGWGASLPGPGPPPQQPL